MIYETTFTFNNLIIVRKKNFFYVLKYHLYFHVKQMSLQINMSDTNFINEKNIIYEEDLISEVNMLFIYIVISKSGSSSQVI